MTVCWFSAGVSSFIAAYFAKPDKIIYIDIDDQHSDSMRFVKDCEAVLGHKIDVLKSPYKTVQNACMSFGFIASAHGAKCTDVLKKRVRRKWELQQTQPLTYIWGFDRDETDRAERLKISMPEVEHQFPLIDKWLSKADCHAICGDLGVKRPAMYDMGYNNNNCVGCVKGGMGYWNKIRVDFPDVFNDRVKMERALGHTCIKGVFLDELEPNRGDMSSEVLPECGIFCMLATQKEGEQ